ncbi:hypothetical protein TSUD_58950 [Trifolium subterraneum]|uniref:Uncharacterized protein n=1 Tax=Trifolium subterraneum TaxID=3900 RepID=A0A2Z6NBX1_TRISU|nr:hypothetical protein TSUD_58950 [Trifolium subterraneum]
MRKRNSQNSYISNEKTERSISDSKLEIAESKDRERERDVPETTAAERWRRREMEPPAERWIRRE